MLAKIVAPLSEERVQLFELDAHGQLRSLEGVRSQRADVFMESIEVHDAFLENPVDERACAAQQLGGSLRCDGEDAVLTADCASRICARFS